jgi:hypothetical protein
LLMKCLLHVGTKDVRRSNLRGTPHPIFDRKRWPGMEDRRFNAMNQSVLLASILLEIGMPYLASWLPEPNFRTGHNPRVDNWRLYDLVDIRITLVDEDIQDARNELNEIANGLEWREDPEMLENNGWWGSQLPAILGQQTI